MIIQAFLREIAPNGRKISLGFFNAESLWDAREQAQKRHRKMLDRMQCGGFEVMCEPATDAEIAPKASRLRDTTPDLLEASDVR